MGKLLELGSERNLVPHHLADICLGDPFKDGQRVERETNRSPLHCRVFLRPVYLFWGQLFGRTSQLRQINVAFSPKSLQSGIPCKACKDFKISFSTDEIGVVMTGPFNGEKIFGGTRSVIEFFSH